MPSRTRKSRARAIPKYFYTLEPGDPGDETAVLGVFTSTLLATDWVIANRPVPSETWLSRWELNNPETGYLMMIFRSHKNGTLEIRNLSNNQRETRVLRAIATKEAPAEPITTEELKAA